MLKQLAHEKGLLTMGSDYEAVVINDAALRFGGTICRGNVGATSTSDTSNQELNVCIHEFDSGISQPIGTGGCDLGEKIGGLMMPDVIGMLEASPQAKIITLISKPPALAVTHKVLEHTRACHKPVVVCFLGREVAPADEEGLQFTRGTKEATLKAILPTDVEKESLDLHPPNWSLAEEARIRLTSRQKYIRGLFCGSMLHDGTMFAAVEKHAEVYSNAHPDPVFCLKDLNCSVMHTFLGFGDDDFINGKLHPIVGPASRISRPLRGVCDLEVNVIVMDFVLEFGSHEDPVGVMLDVIVEAKVIAVVDGHPFEILDYVLEADLDTPSLEKQCRMLTDAGIIWTSSSTDTGLLAREFICKREET